MPPSIDPFAAGTCNVPIGTPLLQVYLGVGAHRLIHSRRGRATCPLVRRLYVVFVLIT